jgi:hypothetical protein
MRAILVLCLLLAAGAVNAETLKYNVKFKGALSGFTWSSMAKATITTRKVDSCNGWGSCLNTKVNMSSKGHKLLESLYPTRFHYQSFFQQEPLRTLGFEQREKKSKDKYQPYGYRHKLVTLTKDGNSMDYHVLWSKGKPLPQGEAQFVSSDHNGGKPPVVGKTSRAKVEPNALDRWAMIHTARFLPFKPGYSKKFPGTNGSDKLTFKVSLVDAETIEARGKSYKAWKVAITEKQAGKNQPTLYLWISGDSQRLPLRIEMEEAIGRVRFNLI